MNWFFNCSLTQTDPQRPYSPACDIIMCIPLVVSAHNFPIHKKYVLQHPYQSTSYKLVSKNMRKNDRYIWSEWIYALLLHPLSKRRKALQLTFWQKRCKNSDVFLSFCLNSNQEYGSRKEKRKKLPKTFGRYVVKFLPLHPLSERNAIADWFTD